MLKKFIAGAAAACILFTSVFGLLPSVAKAETNTIHIQTLKDLKDFANNCKLDSYSENLTVELDCDLNLEEDPFTPIPCFMGTFHGNNHTIKGFICATDGSNQGFFRYIEAEGTVCDLNVEGEVAPESGQGNIGGLAGTNYGTISNCSFNGNVTGLVNTGGLVGYNEGTILDSTVSGEILGKNYTGGICGYNKGSIAGCSNDADVNVKIQERSIDLEKLSLLDIANLDTVTSTDSDIVIDTGGIVGGSKGIVKDCTNNGTVGYQHYGYNVGGIAGRQSGFLTGSVNNGMVYGRKDVAGICGQMEPYLYIEETESLVTDLQDLTDSISCAISNLSGNASAMQGALYSLQGQTSSVTSDAQTYEEYLKELYKKATGEEDSTEESGDDSGDGSSDSSGDGSGGTTDSSGGSTDVNGGSGNTTGDGSASSDSSSGSAIIDAAQQIGNDLSGLLDGLDQQTKDDITSGNVTQDDIQNIISTATGNGSSDQAAQDAAEQAAAQQAADQAAQDAAVAAQQQADQAAQDAAAAEQAAQQAAADQAAQDAAATDQAAQDAAAAEQAAAEQAAQAAAAAEQAAAAAQAQAAAEQAAQQAAQALEEAAQQQAEKEALEQVLTDVETTVSTKLQAIGNAISSLNNSLAGTTGQLASDLANVNAKFEKVNNLMTRILTGDMTYYQDISELDTEDDVDGKISYCTNNGNVEGDEDVAGVSGEIALEKDFDVEEDLATNALAISGIISQMYETRAVIRSCTNNAPVYSKKNYAGGIAGKATTGIVLYSENYGDISSDAEYVGGIVGDSDTRVIGSYAMCNLSGTGYVGGIAGSAEQVTDCLTMVSIADEQNACTGAIAGYIDVTVENSAVNNYYISDTLGAIDGISYKGKAEPVTSEQLFADTTLPASFRNMVVTFEADDVTVKIVKVEYGQNINADDIPAVPEKEGYTGEWDNVSLDNITSSMTVEALYYPKQSSLETKTLRNGELPVLLVEGEFSGNASVAVSDYEGTIPETIEGETENAQTGAGKNGNGRTLDEEAGEMLEAITVSLDTGDQKESADGYQVRYLAPEKQTDVVIYRICDNGNLEKLSTEIKGSYISFRIPGAETSFVCFAAKKDYTLYIAGGCAAVGLVVLIILVKIMKKIRKKKKTGAKKKTIES